jgi:hypothetical protein
VVAVRVRMDFVDIASKRNPQDLYMFKIRCRLQGLRGRCELVSLCSHELRVAHG